MRLGRKRKISNETVYWDVMVALSVLLGTVLLFVIYLIFSTTANSPHYPKPGWGEFWAYWAENPSIIDQPLTMFTLTLVLLTAWLFVLFLTSRGSGRRRLLPERTAMAASLLLISAMAVVTDDLIDIVTGRYSLAKWDGTIFGVSMEVIPAELEYFKDEEERRYWVRIEDEWGFVIDGDSIRLRGRAYRLWGIDALEAEQRCVTDDWWRPQDCGKAAREAFLAQMERLPGPWVKCTFPDRWRYPGTISCRVGNADVAEWLVRLGYAFPAGPGRYRYGPAMDVARAGKRGAWGTNFLHPQTWKDASCNRIAGVCRTDYDGD